MKNLVIYHRADFDGIFCREIARKFLPAADTEFLGWDFGDAPVVLPTVSFHVYILDLPVDRVLGIERASSYGVFAVAPNITWIDHHASSISSHATDIPGYRIDGVAACRLAWQWFHVNLMNERSPASQKIRLPAKQQFVEREVFEPRAVQLAGEYDVWDKRDPKAEVFQHGLRSQEISPYLWTLLLSPEVVFLVDELLDAGKAIQYVKTQENKEIIEAYGFEVVFEGLTFLACNAARFNSLLFAARVLPSHDGLMGFNWTGKHWRVSLYGAPGKPEIDLSAIAVKYGGGGHKQACGFKCAKLPWMARGVLATDQHGLNTDGIGLITAERERQIR